MKVLQGYFLMSELYLGVLVILNSYWQYLFICMLYKAIFEAEVVDIQNDVLNQTAETKEVKEGTKEMKEENKVK